jgi:DNA repair protein RadD
MTLAREGSRLKVTYHDEDGTRVSERFDFAHSSQRAVFNRVFSRRLASGRRPLQLTEAEQALTLEAHFPRPDFVVARKKKGQRRITHWYQVQERIFDYQGPHRKAFAT